MRIASRQKSCVPAWHEKFLTLLPAIRQHAHIVFRHLDPEAREDAVQEVICNACCAVARLAKLGKLELAYASALARFGVAQVNDGRRVGCKMNVRDVLSRYCQQKKGIVVERLDKFDTEENQWREAVVQDTRTAPVPEIVAFRCDFTDWLANLPRRDRRIAESLALGNGTTDVAKKFKVCAGRVSQLRREFAESWRSFVGESPDATAVA
jgi:hypothetical protein